MKPAGCYVDNILEALYIHSLPCAPPVCSLYAEATECIQRLMTYCLDSPNDELEIGESVLTALQASRGHLCDNPNTYKRQPTLNLFVRTNFILITWKKMLTISFTHDRKEGARFIFNECRS